MKGFLELFLVAVVLAFLVVIAWKPVIRPIFRFVLRVLAIFVKVFDRVFDRWGLPRNRP